MRNIILLAASLLMSGVNLAQTTVTIKLSNIEAPGKGNLIGMLYDSPDGFPREHDKAAFRVETSMFTDQATLVFTNVPSGSYAIMVYQDLNENAKMDTNFIGFPKEPLGLANMNTMRKPSFERVKVAVGDQPISFDIKLLNQ